jgi:2'-5' RNA ligase
MYAIISELDPEASLVVKDLWNKLREACNLMAIYELPTPHLTWLTAEELDVTAVERFLADLSNNTQPLTSFIFGFGIFSGDRPVFYMPLVKSQAMIDLHKEIWRQSTGLIKNENRYYSPNFWLPHITLAINDITKESLACALKAVAFETVEMQVIFNNLLVVSQQDLPANMANKRFQLSDKGVKS